MSDKPKYDWVATARWAYWARLGLVKPQEISSDE